MIIRNCDTRSGDYDRLRSVARPSHADLTGFINMEAMATFEAAAIFREGSRPL